MTLRERAEHAAREIHDSMGPPNDVCDSTNTADAIERVAREFAEKTCAQLSYLRDLGDTGRPDPVEWHLKTYERNIADAIAEAEKG